MDRKNYLSSGLFGAVLAVAAAVVAISMLDRYQVKSPQPTQALRGFELDSHQCCAESPSSVQTNFVQASAPQVWKNEVYGTSPPDQRIVGDRVISLPEDGETYYLTIFTTPGWQQNTRETNFVNGFSQDARLASLKKQTHWKHYTSNDVMYCQKFANAVGNRFPAMALTDSRGKVVSKYSAENVPATADELGNLVAGDLRNSQSDCPDCRPRPHPSPTPAPTPAPTPGPTPSPGPPVIPDSSKTPTKDDPTPIWLYAIVAIVGAGLGLTNEYRKTYST